MKISNLLYTAAIGFLFFSCEEIPMEIPDPDVIVTGKTVLVEDLTGVKCGPCGPAAILLNDIIKNSNGAVIAYGIHGDLQSSPHPESKYDFRYPDAFEFETNVNTVNFQGKPAALFNRIVDQDGNQVADGQFSTWQARIDDELRKEQVLDVVMSTTYNVDTRQIDVFISVESLEAISGDLNLNVVVAESKLIDPQSTLTMGVVPDFEHNHVMKESLTDLSGDFLVSGFSQGETIQKQYSYTLPDQNNGEWIAENMEIIAFVTSQSLDGEVLQAAMTVLPQ